MSNKTEAADFYLGRGESAVYIGTLWGDNVDPESLKAITRFQSRTDALYGEIDFSRDVQSLRLGAEFERQTDGREWPHEYPNSVNSDWAYCFDKATVHVYEQGRLIMSLLCNGARKDAEFPLRGGL